MKKWRVWMAALLGVAVATPAMAINVEWHGDFNNRFSYSTQADFSKRIVDDKQTYYQIGSYNNISVSGVDTKKNSDDAGFFAEIKYRAHLVVSDDEKKVKGVLGLEIGSLKYGDSNLPLGGDSKEDIELRWAYTDIEVPFDAASRLSVGLQPVGYNDFVWSDNAAGVKWARKAGHWGYTLGWWRTDWEPTISKSGTSDASEDGEIYTADATYKYDTGSVNGFVIYRNQGEDKTFGGTATDPGVTVDRDSEIWLGLSGKNTWGDLSLWATGIYLTGEAKTTEGDFDRNAFLFHGQFDYKMGKSTLTLGGLYASGDDDPNDEDFENFDHIDIGTSVLGSVVIFDNYADDNSPSQAFYVFDQGYKIVYAGVKYALNSKTDVWGKYFWHNTAEDELLGDDEIGHELVVGASYTIMKGLKAEINAGYLVAGDALDALASDGDADDIFRTDARIRLKF